MPVRLDDVSEGLQLWDIAGHAVVSVVTAEHRAEPSMLFVLSLMCPAPNLLVEFGALCFPLLPAGSTPEREPASAIPLDDVSETKEVERLGASSPVLSAVPAGVAPEPNHSRLLGV